MVRDSKLVVKSQSFGNENQECESVYAQTYKLTAVYH